MRLTPALYYEKQNIQALAVMIKLKEAIKNKDNCRFALGVKLYIVIVVFGRKKKTVRFVRLFGYKRGKAQFRGSLLMCFPRKTVCCRKPGGRKNKPF